MPVHELRYRRWHGKLERRLFRWIPIMRCHVRLTLKRKLVWLILFLSFLPAIGFSAAIYADSRAEGLVVVEELVSGAMTDQEVFADDDRAARYQRLTRSGFLLFLLAWQSWFVLFTTSTVGAGLIARDKKSNALEIYLSRPITASDYVLGKLSVIALFVMMVTFVPSLVLFLVASVMWDGYMTATWPLLGRLFVACAVAAIVNGLVILALSSLARSSRFATGMWFALCVLSSSAGTTLHFVTREPMLYLVGYRAPFEFVFNALLGGGVDSVFFPGGLGISPAWPIGLLLFFSAASCLVLRRTIRAVTVS